jgi:hypothetical protein
VKTRGVIFSGPMVCAILEGKKQQTRRVHAGGDVCPYGVAGDRLWVRETFARLESRPGTVEIVYRATCPGDPRVERWKSPLFLPKACSRLLLEVTATRLERLHEITEADAVLEGCAARDGASARDGYRAVWDSLNGKHHPWAENARVWVVDFERVLSTS